MTSATSVRLALDKAGLSHISLQKDDGMFIVKSSIPDLQRRLRTTYIKDSTGYHFCIDTIFTDFINDYSEKEWLEIIRDRIRKACE